MPAQETFNSPQTRRSWSIGFSRVEDQLRTHSRAFKLEELANWIFKN
jgi:hypothetical protein